MAQQIIDVGIAPDDGQGDTLREGFIKTNDNFTEIYTAGPVGSNVRIVNNTITTTVTNGDLVLSPNGVGVTKVQSGFVPTYNNVYELGSPTNRWGTGYIGTGGLDVAGPAAFRGNLEVNNLIANNISFTDVSVTGNLTVAGRSNLGNAATANYFIGDGSLLTNVRGATDTKIQNGTSNVNIASANGNVTIAVGGVSNIASFSNTAANINGNLTVSGNTLIEGNLTVDGNVTYINITSLEVQDPIIGLGRGPNNTPLTSNDGLDRGTRLWYYNDTEKSAFFGFDNSQQKLIAATNVSVTNELVTVQDYGTIDVGNVSAVGNISANYVIGNGTVLTSVMTDRGFDQSNYDTLTQMGVYTVNRVSWSGVTGAPTDSMVTVGLLEVKTSTNMTTVQSFYPGTITDDVKIQFDRTLWDGVWTPWVRLTSNGQQIEGGSY